MKKIGIITYHRAFSYGAQLQAYALATYLKQLEFNAEVIDYSDIGEGKRPGISLISIKVFIKTLISYILSIPNEDKRRKRFEYFLNNYIPKSSKRYPTPDSIREIEKNYDFFITGSDQVWCPLINLGDLNFLLNFVKDKNKKFAYAASFGVSQLEPEVFDIYKRCLSEFKRILIRENDGQKLIDEMLGYKPDIVLDPTFLISPLEWSKLSIYPFKKREKYILCFKIITATPIYYQYIRALHEMTGYKIIHIDTSYRYKRVYGNLYSKGGPLEWLGLIENAAIVVTNSFHGTVFSILFHKPFYTVLNQNDRNSRIIELTKKFHLEDRLVCQQSPLPAKESIPVDYKGIERLIIDSINESKELIKETFQL